MRRRRGLSAEEEQLWSRIARSASPLHKTPRESAPPAASGGSPSIPDPAARPVAPALPRFRVGQAAALPRSVAAMPPYGPAERLAAAALRMDHKTHRKMVQGKLRPEARLDLHGMTLAQAQPVLVRFILSCHGAGMRLVLVITGKGRGDHGPLPTRPGALRHQVPHWLHSPPLAALVQQVTAAHHRHGGQGAYYVYLRRPAG